MSFFFGGFMSLTLALGKLLEAPKGVYHYAFSGIMFCLGGLQLLDGLFVIERLHNYPALIFWHFPFLAWIGPFFYFAFRSANNESYHLKLIDYLHFLPGLLVILAMIPLITMEGAIKNDFITSPPDLTRNDSLFRLYSGISIAVITTIIIYLFYFFRECFFMLHVRKKKISWYLIIIILISFPLDIIFFSGMLTISYLESSRFLYLKMIQTLTALSFFLTLALFIMEKKNINVFKILYSEVRQRQYEKQKIKNIDVSIILSRIGDLMEDEKIFCEEELSVNTLAEKLGIRPYQLSRIINENFEKNFNTYVNEYRVKEAQKILQEENERTIISIAYQVGFNSTTVFNDWFKRITGVSPKNYRTMKEESTAGPL